MKRCCSGLRTSCLRLRPGLLSPQQPLFPPGRASSFSPFSPFHVPSSTRFRPTRPFPPCCLSLIPPSGGWRPSGLGALGLWPSAAALWPQHSPGAGLWTHPAPRSLSPGPSPSNPDAHPLALARTRTSQRTLCRPFGSRGLRKSPSPARRGCVPRGVVPPKCTGRGWRRKVESARS